MKAVYHQSDFQYSASACQTIKETYRNQKVDDESDAFKEQLKYHYGTGIPTVN